MRIINVILSGGVGSRLWPLSRKSRPKQYLPIFEGQTLFQKTAERNLAFCTSLMVVGNQENYHLSRKDLEKSGITDYTELIEASPRNTAAAIAFAAFYAKPEDILFITPSDQLVDSAGDYSKAVTRALDLAKEGFIVTFGLKPIAPETGFGYIEAMGEEVKGFYEKPSLDRAEAFLKAGNFFWNSGMFCFSAKVFLQELEKYEPNLFQTAKIAFQDAKEGKFNLELSLKIPAISIDYAVMERTKKIKMIPSNFNWSDMGSFESLYQHLIQKGQPRDSNGNMVIGSKKHVEFLGLFNSIYVETEDAVLILQREFVQEVKQVYERLEKENPELIA